MKRNHRIPALALALAVAASLAACSGGAPAETGTTAPQTSAPVQTGTADTDGHYPVTITNYDYSGAPVTYIYEKAPERVLCV